MLVLNRSAFPICIKLGGEARKVQNLSSIDSGLAGCLRYISSLGSRSGKYWARWRCVKI